MKKEIISRFRDNPKEKKSWKALWLPMVTVLWAFFIPFSVFVIRPLLGINEEGPFPGYFSVGMLGIFLALLAFSFISGYLALKKGERSWAVVIGFGITLFICLNLLVLIVGEFAFPH